MSEMTALEKSAKKDVWGMVITVLLYAIGAVSVPYIQFAKWLSLGKDFELLFGFLSKTLCSILPIYLIFQFGFGDLFTLGKDKFKAFLFTVPAFLIMLNNLPVIPVISGDMSINAHFLTTLTYILYCLSIGVLEETVFRGCILPLLLYKFSKDKKGVFWAVIISSAIFGGMHLLNLLSGFSPMVFLQVGYAFLIGAVCGYTLVVSGNIYLPILFHAIFDVGGLLLTQGLAVGTLWTTVNVVWTAISSVVLGIAIIIIFFKKDFSHQLSRLNLNRVECEKGDNK